MYRTIFLLIIILILLIVILIFLPSRQSLVKSNPTPLRTGTPLAYEEIPAATPRVTEKPAAPVIQPEKTTTAVINGKIAIVIDDAGNSSILLKPFLLSAARLTIAVLPGLQHSAESARLASVAGKEVLLHLPMEAINGNNTGPGAVFTYNSTAEILQTLKTDFADVSQAKGINNHMGSKATTDNRVMDTVMQYLQSTGKFFLDSKTVASALPAQYAQKYNVPYLSRDVFLDNETDKDYIRSQLRETIKLSLAAGNAIAIGHVQNIEVLEVINEFLPEFRQAGIELVYLSELL